MRGEQESFNLVVDDLGGSADARREDGPTGSHRLRGGAAERLLPGWDEQCVDSGEDLGHILALAEEADSFLEARVSYQTPQLRCKGRIVEARHRARELRFANQE
jgi:hypothetical protein